MRLVVKSALILALAASLASTAAYSDTIRTWQSGDWQAASYANNETKSFEQCRAHRAVDAKTTFIILYSRSYHWLVGLASSDPYQTTVGATQPISLHLDQGAKWTFQTKIVTANLLEANLTSMPDLLAALRRSHQLAFETADGHRGIVNLGGTDKLMTELELCVQTQMAAEKGGQPPAVASSGTTPPPQPGALPPQAPVQPIPPELAAQLDLAATRIASNLLLQAKLPNAHLLAPSETPAPLRGHGAAWTSTVGTGAVAVIPPGAGRDPNQVALAMIVGAGAACKGEFAAGRSTTLVDDTLVTKAFTACTDSSGTHAVHYFVLHRESSWYIVHAVMAPQGAMPQANSPIEDAAFQAAVVKAALYQ